MCSFSEICKEAYTCLDNYGCSKFEDGVYYSLLPAMDEFLSRHVSRISNNLKVNPSPHVHQWKSTKVQTLGAETCSCSVSRGNITATSPTLGNLLKMEGRCL